MADEQKYIAVDLGAESGRVMLGIVSADKLRLEESHRFPHGPIEQNGSLRWDFDQMLSQVKTGIAKAVAAAGKDVAGIAVDSWGVDFGLLDEKGRLIENPYHYRDSRTNGMMEKAFELIPKRQIYENTGIQFMQLNSIYQLLAMRLADSPTLKKTKKLLFMADLVSYYLCGRAYTEYTLASTSQLMDMRTAEWSKEIFTKLSLPIEIMPDVVLPGTVVGTLSTEVAAEIGYPLVPVIATGSHDTASAVAAVPAEENTNWAYLSSGTWSPAGAEISKPIVTEKSFEHEFTNEGGAENTIRLLKNVMGLWLVQECKRQWQKDGHDFSYAQLTTLAEKAAPFAALINIDDPVFLAPGDMPARINQQLEKSGQKQITDTGQMVRIILEAIALMYRRTIEQLEQVTGKTIDRLHIVGGGSKNTLLNQFAANATGKKVITGPVEATAVGNILIQAKATGRINSVAQARQLVRNSFELTEYQPKDTSLWQKHYNKMQN